MKHILKKGKTIFLTKRYFVDSRVCEMKSILGDVFGRFVNKDVKKFEDYNEH